MDQSGLPDLKEFIIQHGNKYADAKKPFDADDEEDQCEPNMKFLESFDNIATFEAAATFMKTWLACKAHNATDFATDFPALLSRGLLLRRTLLSLRKEQGYPQETQVDEKGRPVRMEISRINKRILTKTLYETSDDYTVNFTLNLLGSIC